MFVITVVLLHQYFTAKKLLKDSAEFFQLKNDFEYEKLAIFDGFLDDVGKRYEMIYSSLLICSDQSRSLI